MNPNEVYKGSRGDRRSSRRQSLEINFRQEIQGYKLLLTSYKCPNLNEMIETLLNKFQAIEELAFMILTHDENAFQEELESSKTLSKSLTQISEANEARRD